MWPRRRKQEVKAVAEPAVRPVARDDYRAQRLAHLARLVDPARAEGLEIGAFDLPTVDPGLGRCEFADAHSRDELSRVFAIPLESIAPVTYLLERGRGIAEQIPRRFDYVVLCHVLEHVPNPVGFLNDVARLLRPGGVLFLAIPDKRRTDDACRPSTTIDQILERHHLNAPDPPLAQIMEFARAWLAERREMSESSPRAFYEWAVAEHASGRADVHCNVWRDDELFAQLDYLVAGGFLPGLSVRARVANLPEFNEFYVALEKAAAASASPRPDR